MTNAPTPRDLLARQLCEEAANVVAALGMRIGGMPEAAVPTLVFLVDRAMLRERGHALLRGPWASTPDGPVHVGTRDLLRAPSRPSSWGRHVHVEGPVGDRTIRAVANRTHDDLDLLSAAAHDAIAGVARRFGRMTPAELTRWCAEDPEAADCRPSDPETPIDPVDVLVAGGMDRSVAREAVAEEASLVGDLDMLAGRAAR